MSERSESPAEDVAEGGDADHLSDIEDGAGCAEIWERLSERREREDSGRDETDGGE